MNSIILPLVVLYDDSECKNNFIGYIMDKVHNITELQNIYYKNELSLFQKVTVAMNLCIMVNLVHGAGQVIGDLNPKNIAFDKQTGTGVLIDTDSFHITVKKSTDQKGRLTFPCTVGVEALIAPELKEKLKNSMLIWKVYKAVLLQEKPTFMHWAFIFLHFSWVEQLHIEVV